MMGINSNKSSSTVNDMIVSFGHDLNLVSDVSVPRNDKIAALTLVKQTCDSLFNDPNTNSIDKQRLFDTLWHPMQKTLCDKIEKMRQLGVSTLKTIGLGADVADLMRGMQSLLPLLVEKLAEMETLEPSEEQRLLMLQLLVAFVSKIGPQIVPCIDDILLISTSRLSDTFPEVQRTSAQLIVLICVNCPSAFHSHVTKTVKSLLPLLSHKHSATRLCAIDSIGKCIEIDASPLKDVFPCFFSIVHDRTAQVREAMYVTAANWMLTIPDRWSTADKTLPLVLAGLTDPAPSSCALVESKLDKIGSLYEEEWEDKLKDDLNYASRDLSRKRAGLRYLARENTLNIVKALLEKLEDWREESRIVALRILYSFLPLVEVQITGYFGQLEPALRNLFIKYPKKRLKPADVTAEAAGKLCGRDSKLETGTKKFSFDALMAKRASLAKKAAASVEQKPAAINDSLSPRDLAEKICCLLGEHVDTVVWTRIAFSSLSMNDSRTPRGLEASLDVLERLISGCKTLSDVDIEALAFKLGSDDVLSCDLSVTHAFTGVLTTLATKWGPELPLSAYLALYVAGLGSLDLLESLEESCASIPEFQQSKDNLEKFKKALTTSPKVFEREFVNVWDVLDQRYAFKVNSESWTRSSLAPRVFEMLVIASGDAILIEARFETYVLPFFLAITNNKNDDYLKLDLLKKCSGPLLQQLAKPEAIKFGSQVVLDCLCWRPGRFFIAMRREAIRVFANYLAIVEPQTLGLLHLATDDWTRLLEELVDDDDLDTRRYTLETLSLLVSSRYPDTNVSTVPYTAALIKKLFLNIAKRLDDASDELRIKACSVLVACFDLYECWQTEIRQLLEMHSISVELQCNGVTLSQQVVQGCRNLGFEAVSTTPDSFYLEIALDQSHFEHLVQSLAVHLDDMNEAVQSAVLAVFKRISEHCSYTDAPLRVFTRDFLEAAKSKYRHVDFIGQSIEYFR